MVKKTAATYTTVTWHAVRISKYGNYSIETIFIQHQVKLHLTCTGDVLWCVWQAVQPLQLGNDSTVFWLMCSVRAYALVMGEATAVTIMCSHTCGRIFWTAPLQCAAAKKRLRFRWRSHRNIAPSRRCGVSPETDWTAVLLIQWHLLSQRRCQEKLLEIAQRVAWWMTGGM